MNVLNIAYYMMLEYLLILKLKVDKFIKKKPSFWLNGFKNPVVIIPGFHGTYWSLANIAAHLNKKGYPISVIEPFNSIDTVKNLSDLVGNYIKSHNLKNVIILAHSKGGIIAKYLLVNDNDINSRVNKVVAIASPFNGTIFGHLHFDNIFELKPTSPLVVGLQQDKSANNKFVPNGR